MDEFFRTSENQRYSETYRSREYNRTEESYVASESFRAAEINSVESSSFSSSSRSDDRKKTAKRKLLSGTVMLPAVGTVAGATLIFAAVVAVIKVALLSLVVSAGGDIKVVNNSDIRTLVNMTSQLSLAISEVDVEYGESLERVEVVIRDNLAAIADNIPDIVEGPYYMGVSKLGSSGVTLRFTAKCPEMQKFQVERDLNRQIKLLFDKYDINIPFTQVVVHDASALKRPAPAPETPVVGVSAAEDATAEAFRRDEAQDFVDEQRALSRGLDDESRN